MFYNSDFHSYYLPPIFLNQYDFMVSLIKFFVFSPFSETFHSKYYNTNTNVAYINILGKSIINTFGSMLNETIQSKKHSTMLCSSIQNHSSQEGPERAQAHIN